MISRLGLRVLALALPLALLAPAAAQAERVMTEDALGDVVAMGPTEPGEDDLANLVPTPDNTTVDVLRTIVDHDDSRLRVRIVLRELGAARLYFAALRLRTPAAGFEVEVDNLGRTPRAQVMRRSRAVECPRLRVEVDRSTARINVTIPTVCLESPRWVQVGVGVAAAEPLTRADGSEQRLVHADDALRVGDVRNQIAVGPRVRRG